MTVSVKVSARLGIVGAFEIYRKTMAETVWQSILKWRRSVSCCMIWGLLRLVVYHLQVKTGLSTVCANGT